MSFSDKNPVTSSKNGFFKHLFASCKDFLSSFKCSCGSSRFETHHPCTDHTFTDLNEGRSHVSKNLNITHANSELEDDDKDDGLSHKKSCDNIKSMNFSSSSKPLSSNRNEFQETSNNDCYQNTLHVHSQASDEVIDDFLISSNEAKSHDDSAGEIENVKKDGFFSSLLIRAETAAMGFFLGKNSLRTLARISIGKAGVDLVDKTHELVHSLFDDPKEANKFINYFLKGVSEFGVLMANGKISCEDMMSLREEFEHACETFLHFNDNLSVVNENALDTAKRILNESVCRLEHLTVEMLPNQSEGNKSVKTIRQLAKFCRQPMIIDKLYDKSSDAFRVAEEFGEKCEQINYLAELILSDRQQNLSNFINNSSQNRNLKS